MILLQLSASLFRFVLPQGAGPGKEAAKQHSCLSATARLTADRGLHRSIHSSKAGGRESPGAALAPFSLTLGKEFPLSCSPKPGRKGKTQPRPSPGMLRPLVALKCREIGWEERVVKLGTLNGSRRETGVCGCCLGMQQSPVGLYCGSCWVLGAQSCFQSYGAGRTSSLVWKTPSFFRAKPPSRVLREAACLPLHVQQAPCSFLSE